jgi:hypothetical protein
LTVEAWTNTYKYGLILYANLVFVVDAEVELERGFIFSIPHSSWVSLQSSRRDYGLGFVSPQVEYTPTADTEN